jgi:hypothetical protein
MFSFLRWFGAVLFGFTSIVGMALVPASGGLSAVLGAPSVWLTIWLVRHDPGKRSDAGPGALVALAVGTLVLAWVFACLIRDTTIFGRPQ